MALPTLIDGLFRLAEPTRLGGVNHQSNIFQVSSAIYVCGIDATASQRTITVYKATDPTSSFTQQDDAGAPSEPATQWQGLQFYERNGLIHCAAMNDDNTGMSRVVGLEYNVFDAESDEWTTTNESVVSGLTYIGTAGAHDCLIVVGDDGVPFILYGSSATFMGGDYNRVHVAYKNGSWTSGVQLDNGGTEHWNPGSLIWQYEQRYHSIFKNHSLDDIHQRTVYGASYTVESFQSAADASIYAGNGGYILHPGCIEDDGTNNLFAAGYIDSDSSISELYDTSADTPGVPSSRTGVKAATQIRGSLIQLGGDRYLFYYDGSGAIKTRKWNGTSWADDGTPVSSGADRMGGVTVVNRADSVVFGFLYRQSADSDWYYQEYDPVAAYGDLTDAEFPEHNYYLGPVGT